MKRRFRCKKNFISDLDKTGQNKITEIKVKIDTLLRDSSSLMSDNEQIATNIKEKHQPELDTLTSATVSLKKKTTIKAKTGTKDTEYNIRS